MKTPAQYQHEIQNLALDQMESGDAARLEELERALVDLERRVGSDVQALRTQHLGQMAALHAPSARRRPSKALVDQEQRALGDRENKLHPYEELRSQVKGFLEKVQQLKARR
jgi:hypothetical protein